MSATGFGYSVAAARGSVAIIGTSSATAPIPCTTVRLLVVMMRAFGRQNLNR
jgi:hypothetical protein